MGNSLAVQWLILRASTAGSTGSIPDEGSKIPHVMQCSQKNKHTSVVNWLSARVPRPLSRGRSQSPKAVTLWFLLGENGIYKLLSGHKLFSLFLSCHYSFLFLVDRAREYISICMYTCMLAHTNIHTHTHTQIDLPSLKNASCPDKSIINWKYCRSKIHLIHLTYQKHSLV